MQSVIKLNDLTEVLDESTFRKQYPNRSFPSPLTPGDITEFGYGMYEYNEKPAPAWNQKVVELTPEQDGSGVYQQRWQLEDLTGPELEGALYNEQTRIKDEIVAREQYQQDAFAKTRGYDDIKSASDYAGCAVPKFDAEGTYCKNARALRWAKLYEIMDEVLAGTRPMPQSHSEIDSELPPLIWPV
jgi:hypothetical protein